VEELRDRVAVVTGAASGIGWAMARRFAAEGMAVVLADVEEDALERAEKELVDTGAAVLAVPTDVSKPEALEALAAAARQRFGTYHVVCNNAGVGGHGFTSWDGPRSEWEWVLGVNLWGVIDGIRTFVPALVEQDEGHVVNTASVAGLGSIPFLSPYNASKHAVVAISESLHHELTMIGSSVKVTVACPGFVRTRIHESERNWSSALGPEPENDHPAGAFMEQLVRDRVEAGDPPDECAGLVVEAIRTGRFLVTTDEPLARAATATRAREVEGQSPALPPLT
jgi:NAD(P)-dependent dehydrogenase (short-subunit alcohol dehydrogenase family)